MAVNKYSAGQGVMDVDTYIDNLNRGIELLWMRKDTHKGVLAKYFDALDVDSLSYTLSSVSQTLRMPVENNDTEELPYVQSAPGRSKTFTLINYRVGVRVTDTMVRADRFNKILAMTGGLMMGAERRLEYLRAAILNGAFSGTDGEDSFSLCYDSHPQYDPGAVAWDNLGTGPLTGANLQALRLIGQKMTNEIGAVGDPTTLQDLAVPPDLEQKATELTTATLTAENSLNTPTVLIRNMGVTVVPHLTSTTAYFGFGDRTGEEKGLLEMYLERPNLANLGNNPVDIPIDKRVKMIVKVGFTVSKNVVGSPGT